MAILIPLKKKYRLYGQQYKKNQYRTRTGPRCCNADCPATRKKGRKR